MGVYIRNTTKEQFIEDCNAMGVLVITEGISEIDLVRCGECKYMSEHYDTDGNLPYLVCLEWDSGTDIDGYCYLGERRTDDKTEESRP